MRAIGWWRQHTAHGRFFQNSKIFEPPTTATRKVCRSRECYFFRRRSYLIQNISYLISGSVFVPI